MRPFLPLLLPALLLCACRNQDVQAILHTDIGDIRVRLYDHTPEQRDRFLKMAETGAYDSLGIQKLLPDLLIETSDTSLTDWQEPAGPAPRGTLVVWRDSLTGAASPFAIVVGRTFTESALSKWQQRTGRRLSPERIKLYLQKGGAPALDGRCLAFGEIISGMEVADRLAALPRNAQDQPLRGIRITVELIRKP